MNRPKQRAQRPEKPLLTISISGPSVKPGRIAVPILLKLCQEAQAAINRQAEVNEARKTDKPAPEMLRRECTLELIALRKGSTTLDFARADKQDTLIPEIAALGVEAVSNVAKTLIEANRKGGKWRPSDQGVLDALDDLGSIFDSGIEKVKWIVPKQNGHKRAAAEFLPATLKRVRQFKQGALPLQRESTPPTFGTPIQPNRPPSGEQQQAPIQESFLEGMLEGLDGKVKITPLAGPPSVLSYDADQYDQILEGLHRSVRVTTKGRKIVSVHVTEAADLFGAGSFFECKTIEQLIAEQNIEPINDLSDLSGAIPDEDVDEFVADIYRHRKLA